MTPRTRRASARTVVRLVDVARAAEVSVATVSRVLNGHPVDPALAERVRDATTRLGYRPNAVARNLRRRDTQVWAVVITDVTNPFFTSLVRGLEDVAQASGFSVLLCNSDEDADKERRYLDVAESERVAGLVLTPRTPATDVSRLMRAGIPIVAVDRPLRPGRSPARTPDPARPDATPEQDGARRATPADTVLTDTVTTSSAAGAAAATDHLLEHGWRRPACISGPLDSVTGAERATGYLRSMRHHGCTPIVRHTSFSAEGGRAAATELLTGGDPPDAFFVANSNLTLGVLTAIADLGKRLRTDVGLISFDDAPWAPLLDPPLTVVSQPAYDLGATAGRLLLARIHGEAEPEPVQVTLPTTLVERASCRRR